ncbi:serine hydrolase [Altererythrobacter salegens]|uniref:Serine hydrolase n=1 Tax=Croceibacterium salegens TaxID=1737568 RepID=A0A6I4SXT1_9SPHN|nr:serine hydrolase domain-containing protein [Croceibacterium salegens]MXO60663.1 serine hydrolase [Croceibacterium salegens]
MRALGQEVAGIIARHVDKGSISGAITLFMRNGVEELIDVQGTADVDPSFQLEADSIFPIFSLTKVVTAACVAQLVAEGRLSVDDPVSRWIPSFSSTRRVRYLVEGEAPPEFYPGFGPLPAQPQYLFIDASEEIRVHHLLTMTSGLQTIGIFNPDLPAIEPEDDLASWVKKLGSVSLDYEPGSRWSYSNAAGFDILGRIVELVSGSSFADFATKQFFDPLDMRDTMFGLGHADQERILPCGSLMHVPVLRPGYLSGSAGLISTARDYAQFVDLLLSGDRHAASILAPEARKMIRRNQIGALGFPGVRAGQYATLDPKTVPGLTYGYGVAIVEAAVADISLPIGSFGWDGIGTRRAWAIPQLDAVLVMLVPGIGAVADETHAEIEAAVCKFRSG